MEVGPTLQQLKSDLSLIKKGFNYLFIHTPKDDSGRQSFDLYWWSDQIGYSQNESGLGGQCFKADLSQYINEKTILLADSKIQP